jgi:hypothetical protein
MLSLNLVAWLRSRRERRAAERLAQRRVHAANVWPQLWKLSQGHVLMFIDMCATRTSRSPAWRYPREWVRTPEDPGVWAAERVNERARATCS